MGQKNTDSIQHLVGEAPNAFRDEELFEIINDIDEERTGKGFTQIIRPVLPAAQFITNIITWNEDPDSPPSNPNARKRVETIFTRPGGLPFVSQIVTNIYDKTGLVIKAIITATVTRTGGNFINSETVTIVRP